MSTEHSSITVGAEDEAVASQTVLSPGKRLWDERVARNLSQKEVADKLHITIHYVNAIEHDAYEKLPGMVFAKGYIKSYAELLGLNVQECLDNFEAYQAQLQSGAQEEENQKRRASGKRNLNIAFASVAMFIAVFVGVWFFNGTDNSQQVSVATPEAENLESPSAADQSTSIESSSEAREEVADRVADGVADGESEKVAEELVDVIELAADSVPAEQATQDSLQPGNDGELESSEAETPTLAATAFAANQSQEESVQVISTPVEMIEQAVTPEESYRVITITENGEDVLRISFSGESWVEVNDGTANEVYRDLLEAGDVLQITGEAPFNILLGDAPFTQLTFNGDEVDVSENIRIDNSARLTVGL